MSVTFPCGEIDYRGGDPANKRSGALWLKNAWMELPKEKIRKYGWKNEEAYGGSTYTPSRNNMRR